MPHSSRLYVLDTESDEIETFNQINQTFNQKGLFLDFVFVIAMKNVSMRKITNVNISRQTGIYWTQAWTWQVLHAGITYLVYQSFTPKDLDHITVS